MQIVKKWIIGNWVNLGENLTTSKEFFLDFSKLNDVLELEQAVIEWCNIIESLSERWIIEFEELLWRFDRKEIFPHLIESVKKLKTELELKKIRLKTWDEVQHVFALNEPEQ